MDNVIKELESMSFEERIKLYEEAEQNEDSLYINPINLGCSSKKLASMSEEEYFDLCKKIIGSEKGDEM